MRKKTNSIQAQLVRVECAKRQWTGEDLAKASGLSWDIIRHFTCSGIIGQVGRLKIESALDLPIWSTAEEFQKRKRLAGIFGFNPHTEPMGRLKDFAFTWNCPKSLTRLPKEAAIKAIVEWLESHKVM